MHDRLTGAPDAGGVLVIETATAACSVALLDGSTVRAHAHEVVGRGHAERLVPMIAEVLAAAGVACAGAIRVDCGPGSFTGIRVGLAAARALGLAWGVEVAGFGAPALLAAANGEGHDCGVAIVGGHGELFVQRFASDPLRPLDDVCSLPPAAAAAMMPEARVIGSGAEALVAARGSGEAVAAVPDARDLRLLPAALCLLPPRPVYGRAPDAVPAR